MKSPIMWLSRATVAVIFLNGVVTWAAGVEALLSPKAASPGPIPAWLKPALVLNQPQALVFSKSERQTLQRLGLSELALTRQLHFSSEREFLFAQRRLQRHHDWSLSRRRLEGAHVADTTRPPAFAPEQWFFDNRGLAQALDLDPMVPFEVPGVLGEDVRLGKTPVPRSERPVRVAVLDTGIDFDHPDLTGQILRKPSECAALRKLKECFAGARLKELECAKNSDPVQAQACVDSVRGECEKKWYDLKNPEVDQDRNGYPLDCAGWSAASRQANAAGKLGYPELTNDIGHGSHMSGLVAAQGNNPFGFRGIAPQAQIIPVQVIVEAPAQPLKPLSLQSRKSYGPPENEDQLPRVRVDADIAARGLIYALASGADVINMSLCWPPAADSALLRRIVEKAVDLGVIVVAAAGNDATKALPLPCSYDGVICVAAHGPDGAVAYFSNYSSGVDLAAPGVNILSTIPLRIRSLLFRRAPGYDFMSGSSQASAIVAGAAADLISRGVSPREVRARLIASARPTRAPLTPRSTLAADRETKAFQDIEERYVLSGNLDVDSALKVSPRPVLVPVAKTPQALRWDRKTTQLQWQVQFKNIWAPLNLNGLKVSAQMLSESAGAQRPRIVAIQFPSAGSLTQGQILTINLTLDVSGGRNSFLVSDIEANLMLTGPGLEQKFTSRAEIIVPISPQTRASDIEVIPIHGLKEPALRLLKIENLSGSDRPRFWVSKLEEKSWNYTLLELSAKTGAYEVAGKVEVPPADRPKIGKEVFHQRLDRDGDGKFEWTLGIHEQRALSDDPKVLGDKPSSLVLYVLDDQFQIVDTFRLAADRAAIPRRLSWMRVGRSLNPAWVAPGRDPGKELSVIEHHDNPDQFESPKRRLYYFNAASQLAMIDEVDGFSFVAMLPSTLADQEQGVLTVLLSKQLGTKLKPPYLFDFRIARISDGKVIDSRPLSKENPVQLIDVIEGDLLNLERGARANAGMFWFGPGNDRHQRFSWWLPDLADMVEVQLGPVRPVVDGLLRVRAAFAGGGRLGAFTFSNSELQFHDLVSRRAVARSLERYTFFEDSVTVSSLNPMLVSPGPGAKVFLPALYLFQSLRLSDDQTANFASAFKPLVPFYSADGHLRELVAPAALRFRAEGCLPIHDSRLADGVTPAMDFYCYTHLLRIPMQL